MIKLKISQKLLILLLLVSLLPLGTVNFYWYKTAQKSLRTDAVAQQKLLTASAVFRVNQYMTDKVNALIIHSQTVAVQTFNPASAKQDLTNLMDQDSDIQMLALANASGQEVLNINRQGNLPTNGNISNQAAFKAATFLSGKEYISPVRFDSQNHPLITIAAPLVKFSSAQDLLSLSTAGSSQIRTNQQINGVLIATVDLTHLWQSVLAQGSVNGDYTYVVDSEGTLIAHPDTVFQKAHQNLSQTPAVQPFLQDPGASPKPRMLTSEKGVSVLSSYGEVSRTNWGVITEEPVATIFAQANHVALVGISIFAAAALLIAVISYLVSRQVTTPIRRLVAGTALISDGKLDARVVNNSHDEFGILARAFNTMAFNLADLIQRTRAESSKAGIILSNVAEGIVAVDTAGKIVLANSAAARLLGISSDKLIDKPLTEVYRWSIDNKPVFPSLIKREFYSNVVMDNTNHRINYVDVIVNPIANDPTGIHAIITVIDKTGERELENMKVDFVSMAAHELRTPLTAIRGYLDLITHTEGVALSDELKGYIGHMEASAIQLVSLINNLLNVSRIERNQLTISRDKIDWPKTLQRSVEDSQFAAKAKSITLSYGGPASGVIILAEQVTMLEVINNLISNAINYTNKGGTVTVTMTETDDSVITKVIDNGVGIPAASMGHLFTKFYRVRSGMPSGSGGTGLGLYISKSIVELHGGTLSVVSVEGRGSTFSLVLPKFNETEYNKSVKLMPNRLIEKHGWITKNSTR